MGVLGFKDAVGPWEGLQCLARYCLVHAVVVEHRVAQYSSLFPYTRRDAR